MDYVSKGKEEALAQLLIEKGLITEDEFHNKSREVMVDYKGRQKGKVE